MSNLKFVAEVTDFTSAREFLGERNERRLGHNTVVVRDGDGIGVVYHETMIVRYGLDETVVTTGGWNTATTVNRLHKLTPSNVRFNRSQGTVRISVNDELVHVFGGWSREEFTLPRD